MNNLISRLNTLASTSRLNTVEAAYSGSPNAQSNFKATWQGYDEVGNALVKVNGKIYPANGIGITGLALNSSVTLRVGKGIKTVTW
jgi:hypothetical protein